MTKDKAGNFIIAKKSGKAKSKFFMFTLLSVAIILSLQFAAAAQSAVNLGTAGNFVILTKSGISTTGTTSITGDIGVSPIDSTAITGFGLIMDISGTFATSSLVTGKVYAADYTPPTPINMGVAILDMQNAYTDAAGRTLPDYIDLGAGNINGMTLTPGLYKWGTGVTIPNGVTLDCQSDANAVFIFQIAQDLTVGNGAIITMINGCQAKNIFWQVAGQTTLGTTSFFNGIILDQNAIVLNNGATLNGRALAQKAVTLIANKVSLAEGAPVLITIILLPISPNLTISSTLPLNAISLDQFGSPIAATITYASSNSSVATVDPITGLVTAVSPGSATITATSGNVIATTLITVNAFKSIPVMNNNLFILLIASTLILGLYYGFKKYDRK